MTKKIKKTMFNNCDFEGEMNIANDNNNVNQTINKKDYSNNIYNEVIEKIKKVDTNEELKNELICIIKKIEEDNENNNNNNFKSNYDKLTNFLGNHASIFSFIFPLIPKIIGG